MTTGDRVAAREDLEGDAGPVVRGEVGMVVGRRGDEYVVRFGPDRHAVVPGRLLATTREAVNGARQAR